MPLFPLQTVLFPGGLLSLKVFEARYLDLASTCVREQRPFGVVALRKGQEVRRGDEAVVFEDVGVVAQILELDGAQPGILQLRCRGLRRFRIDGTRQQPDGLWIGEVETLPDDEVLVPAETMLETVRGLANAIASLKGKGVEPFEAPYHFDNAGWVANRWCEILPIPLAAKQRLMELADANVRLGLVDEFLRGQGVVK
ncbi:MAG: peptidase S16 [Burkholderiaceae bacterium]|nr:MAG: peptidase S16 [Burkholderiaceae bacterium]